MKNLGAEELRKDIEDIIRRVRPENKGEIMGTDRLREDLGLDSLQSMELLSAVTEKYDLEPDPDQAQELKTVDEVVAFLQSIGS